MSFKIKYNNHGVAIHQPEVQAQLDEAATREEPSQVESVRDVLSPTEPEAEPVESTEPEEPEIAPVVKDHPKRTDAKTNFTLLREKAELAEKRALEAERLLQQYSKTKAVEEPVYEDDDSDISVDEDSLVEGKHLSKVAKQVQQLKQQLRKYEQQSTMSAVESQLKAKYPDFDNIVSGENLANLKAAYPEISHSINSNSDLYSKAVTAYTMIKRLGIAEPEDTFVADKAVAQKNAAKPKPLASIAAQSGDSPLNKANAFATGDLSDDLKKQLWKEMNSYRR